VKLGQEESGEILMYADFQDKFVKEILPELPAGSLTDEEKADILKPNIPFCIVRPINEANKKFVSTNGDPDAVKEAALEIFCQTADCIVNCYPDDNVSLLLAAQIITDKVMQKLSPAGVYPEQYGEYAKGYAINHFSELQEKNSVASTDCDEACYQKAIEAYNDLSKPQKLHINELDEPQNTEIASQIKEEPNLVKDDIVIDK
jgi:hypothetical protein